MTAFTKLLVANRGEIACRIMRTARDLGFGTVAVYSDADADAPHVLLADEAVHIGPSPAASSYLDIERLLDAAARTGADALHPGYGFLAENAGLAQACERADVTFVGPPPHAITMMGDKVQAKRRMVEAGVPTAPAYLGDDQDEGTLLAQARQMGFPLLIKAVAGGGGRGMRIVREDTALGDCLRSARSEAEAAFGRGDVFLERLIERARHVEIQVFCDGHGHAIHLGERECSVQRRHQKIIEEAPSPVVSADLRARMGEAAVTAAKAIDYVGAGTVEFLLDDQGQFFFLEMNTRLQVEHPVTEMVTGLDLVAWQLRIAAGERLPILEQSEVRLHGHAIEARLYAEDPAAGFLPQVGTVHAYVPPRGEGVRVDAGIRQGQVLSPYYDPMIAKIIAHGPDRETARRRLVQALRRTVLLGPVTNRAFLMDLLGGDAFVEAQIRTDDLDRRSPEAPSIPRQAWALAAVLRSGPGGTAGGGDPWRRTAAESWPVSLVAGSSTCEARVCPRGADRWEVQIDGESELVVVVSLGEGVVDAVVGGTRRTLHWALVDEALYLRWDALDLVFREPEVRATASAGASDGSVRAPLAGRIKSVAIESGQSVLAGDTLVVVEAMKMEHRVSASIAGRIGLVSVGVGDQVAGGQLLVQIVPPEGGAAKEKEQ